MRFITLLIFILILFFSCNDSKIKGDDTEKGGYKVNVIKKSNLLPVKDSTSIRFGIQELREFAVRFQPSNIDLSKDINDNLEYFELKEIYSKGSSDSLLDISRIFLLKLNLYHMKRANQGYNLYDMRNGDTRILIDYYLLRNNIDTIGEFLTSTYISKIEANTINKDPLVQRLLQEISIEEKRIEEMIRATEKYEKSK